MRSIRNMRTTQDIVESIDNRLRELNAEIKTLDAARVRLDDHESRPSRRRAARVTTSRKSSSKASSRTKTSARSQHGIGVHAAGESAPRSGKRTRKTSRPRATRQSKAIPADRLESLLSENGGLTTSALAEKTGANRDQLLKLLRDLETAGRIRRTGQRRATRWHTITDEDRIRERVAELEATRRRPA